MTRNTGRKVAENWSSQARTNSIVLIVSMAFFAWFFADNVALSLSSGNWLPVDARIVSSEVDRGTVAGQILHG